MALSKSWGEAGRWLLNTLVSFPLPIRSRARRISGWNRMTSTRIPHSTTRFSSQLVAVSWMAEASHMVRISTMIPFSTRPELVFRMNQKI